MILRLFKSVLVIVYTFFMSCIVPLIYAVASKKKDKFRLRRDGIKNTFRTIPAPTEATRIWVHAASMGEFEQAKPLIELLKERHHNNVEICVTFYSPSGYEHQKNYAWADFIGYIPDDSPKNVRLFIEQLSPDIVVFVRYELWWHFGAEIRKQKIPFLLICATLPPSSWYVNSALGRSIAAGLYNNFSAIYTAGSDETERIMRTGTTTPCITTADTRFDRIAAKVAEAQENRLSIHFLPEKPLVIVIGSSWQPDEELLLTAYQELPKDLKDKICFVIAPHVPSSVTVHRLQHNLSETTLLSNYSDDSDIPIRHLIADSIGKLLRLYSVAHAAYIGGGFGVGVHSVTEPAGYGIPLATGPAIQKARDAVALEKAGALTVIRNVTEAQQWMLELLQQPKKVRQAGETAYNYVHQQTGWSRKIVDALPEYTTKLPR